MTKTITENEYECISDTYINNHSPLLFIHNKCGMKFSTNWTLFRGVTENGKHTRGTRCPFCQSKRLESVHAIVLKQLFLKYKPGTIIEDGSCINPNTNFSLPTDIVDHENKMAIEIQSEFHDRVYQKEKDKIKRNYWIQREYDFYAIDIRDYSVIDMVQLFFKDITRIPSWVNFDFSNKTDITMIQNYLDNGMSVVEISNTTGIPYNTINNLCGKGKVEKPEGYSERINNIRKIVRLDPSGKYLATYNSISEASKKVNCTPIEILYVLQHKRKSAKGFLWFYQSDYLNNNYTIPKLRNSGFMFPVSQYDIEDKYIQSFNSIVEAGKKLRIKNSYIKYAVEGRCKSAGGFHWKSTDLAS